MKLSPARTLVVAGAALALGLGGGVAIADIPSADGTISACYYKSTGAFRVIDGDTQSCKKGEKLLEWNAAGVPGADGVDGADGADGVSGYEIVENDKIPGIGFSGEGAFCPDGKKVIGGGVSPIDDNGNEQNINVFQPLNSYPINDGTAWAAGWILPENPFANNVRVFAICVDALP